MLKSHRRGVKNDDFALELEYCLQKVSLFDLDLIDQIEIDA